MTERARPRSLIRRRRIWPWALLLLVGTPSIASAHEGYARREGLSCQVCHVRPTGGPLTSMGREYLWSGRASPIDEDEAVPEPSRLGSWSGDFSVWGRSSRERVYPGTTELGLLQSALRLHAQDLFGNENVSFEGDLFAQGTIDDGDEGIEEEQVRLVSSAVRWVDPEVGFQLRAGRFWLHEGVATERMDGLALSHPLGERFETTVFAGVPTEDLVGGAGGDLLLGGRLGYHGTDRLSVGLSSFYVTDDNDPRDLKIGADLFWSPAKEVDVSGHVYYDWIGERLYDHRIQLMWKPSVFWHATIDHGRTVPGLLLPKNSIFSVFSNDAFTETSLTLTRRLTERIAVHVFDRLHRAEDGTRSQHVGAGLDLRYGPGGENALVFEATYVDHDRRDDGAGTGTSDAWFLRATHRLFWTGKLSTQIDTLFNLYTSKPFGRNSRVLRFLLGYDLNESCDIQVGVESLRNPEFDSRTDALARVTYRF